MKSAKRCLSSNFVIIFSVKIKLSVVCPLLHVSVPELDRAKVETVVRRLRTITRHQVLTALMKVTRAPFLCFDNLDFGPEHFVIVMAIIHYLSLTSMMG